MTDLNRSNALLCLQRLQHTQRALTPQFFGGRLQLPPPKSLNEPCHLRGGGHLCYNYNTKKQICLYFFEKKLNFLKFFRNAKKYVSVFDCFFSLCTYFFNIGFYCAVISLKSSEIFMLAVFSSFFKSPAISASSLEYFFAKSVSISILWQIPSK